MGALNASLYSTGALAGLAGGRTPEITGVGMSDLLPALLIATVAGLLSAQFLLGFPPLRRRLEGRFLARYFVLSGGIMLGGAVFGALLPLETLMNAGLGDPAFSVGGLTVLLLLFGPVGAVLFGALGLIEGLLFAFPLAAILGLFRRNSG